MKEEMFRKICRLGGVGLLLLSIAGCSSKGSGSADEGPTSLSIYTESATYEGAVEGYSGKYLKDRLNVALNITPNMVGGTARFETKLATGDLGDLIIFTSVDDFNKAIEAGAVFDLKDELSKMPDVSRFHDAVSRVEKNFNGLYGIPAVVSLKSEVTKTDPSTMPSMRFDYYQELGSPEVKEYWDYYDLAEKMVKAHTLTESGDKFYGLSLFSEWDGKSMLMAKQIAINYGYARSDGTNSYEFIMPHVTEDKVENILQEGSYYLKSLQWFNKFYQNGMLDEDSVTQTWQDYLAKANKGQSAIWPFGYMGDLNFNPNNTSLLAEGKGYKRIPFTSMKIADGKTSTIGNNWYWAVSSSSTHKDKAIEFLNFLYSDEGALVNNLGPEGIGWQLNDKGEPEATELSKSPAGTLIPEELGGGKIGDGMDFKTMFNGPTIDNNSVSPILNAPMNRVLWKSYLEDNATKLDKNWSAHYEGALSAKEYILKHNLLASYAPVDVPNFKYDDQLAVKRDQVGEVIKEMSWKMVYAKDDAAFASFQKELIQKAKNLGYDECVSFEEQGAQAWFAARKAAQ